MLSWLNGRTHLAARIAFAAVPLFALPAEAQETYPEIFAETVDVRLVNVDVYVTDKNGRSVEGLTAADFFVFEDGEPVEITNFYSGQAAGSDSQEVGTLPEGPIEDGAESGVAEEPPIWAVLYLDNSALEPGHRRRVLDDLRAFAAAQVGEKVRFLLATRDVSLKIDSEFTTDAWAFSRKLEGVGEASRQGTGEPASNLSFVNTVNGLIETFRGGRAAAIACPNACACAWGQMVGAWDSYAQSATRRLALTIRGLGELVSSLGGLPGRKAVFYVSSGLQQRPGIGMLNYLADVCPGNDITQYTLRYDETERLEELAAHANAGRVTLYPVDAAGLRRDMGAGAEFADLGPSPQTSRLHTANLQASLQVLAEHTGGRAILNANRPLESLERAADDFARFYSLGFRPAHSADGETHQIRVELKEKKRGINLRFRRSYREPRNPLAIRARTGRVKRLNKNEYSVEVAIEIPADSLVQLGQPAQSRIRLVLTAEDTKGRHTPPRQKLIALEVPAEGDQHAFVISLRLRAGHHRIAVGLRDEVGAGESFARLEVEVDPASAELKALETAAQGPA